MHRRRFLTGLAVGAAATLGGCHSVPRREVVLDALVRGVIVPETAIIDQASVDLDLALRRFAGGPEAAGLEEARIALKKAITTWKRAFGFRSGPLVDTGALLKAAFFPPRFDAIDDLARGTAPIDAVSVDELGVDKKGLFALEYLLFGADGDTKATLERLGGAEGPRRKQMAGAFGKNVREWSARATRALGNGENYGKKLASGGQSSLDHLVNQMLDSTESVAVRLRQVAELVAGHRFKPTDAEGTASGTSTDIVLSMLAGTHALYTGGDDDGMATLIQRGSHAIDTRLRAAFDTAVSSVAALKAPLETAAANLPEEFAAAIKATKALELAVKTDLVSALGVTVTWTGVDGD
jgi:predicted lipoprotein